MRQEAPPPWRYIDEGGFGAAHSPTIFRCLTSVEGGRRDDVDPSEARGCPPDGRRGCGEGGEREMEAAARRPRAAAGGCGPDAGGRGGDGRRRRDEDGATEGGPDVAGNTRHGGREVNVLLRVGILHHRQRSGLRLHAALPPPPLHREEEERAAPGAGHCRPGDGRVALLRQRGAGGRRGGRALREPSRRLEEDLRRLHQVLQHRHRRLRCISAWSHGVSAHRVPLDVGSLQEVLAVSWQLSTSH